MNKISICLCEAIPRTRRLVNLAAILRLYVKASTGWLYVNLPRREVFVYCHLYCPHSHTASLLPRGDIMLHPPSPHHSGAQCAILPSLLPVPWFTHTLGFCLEYHFYVNWCAALARTVTLALWRLTKEAKPQLGSLTPVGAFQGGAESRAERSLLV